LCTALAVLYTYFSIPSLDVRPWIPVIGDPLLCMMIVAVLAVIGQIAILIYAMYPGRRQAE